MMDKMVREAIVDGLTSLGNHIRSGAGCAMTANEVKVFLIDEVKRIFEEAFKPPFGYCPHCAARGVSRDEGLCGNDRCGNGHVYPSQAALLKMRGT